MKRLTHGIAIAAILVPFSWAQAQISYSYLEGSFTSNEVETGAFGERDAVGVDLAISYEIESFLHLFAGYRLIDVDGLPLEQEAVETGVGFNFDFDENRNVFLNLSALTFDVELDDPTFGTVTGDDDGLGFAIGYRETNHTRLEFEISLDYVELDKANTSDRYMDMSLQYEITPRFKVLGGIRFGGDDNNFRAGVRYYLPNRLGQR